MNSTRKKTDVRRSTGGFSTTVRFTINDAGDWDDFDDRDDFDHEVPSDGDDSGHLFRYDLSSPLGLAQQVVAFCAVLAESHGVPVAIHTDAGGGFDYEGVDKLRLVMVAEREPMRQARDRGRCWKYPSR
jgi:hypothetical protein